MEYSDNENESDGDGLIDDLLGPEDLFNDEADEDEDGQGGQSDNDGDEDDKDNTDETKTDSKGKVEKKVKAKRIVKNPRVKLNFDTLTGQNGLTALKKLFKDFKFKGSGHEKEDLTKIMRILQQWMCYKLCPSYDFESCMAHLEALGKKKNVQTYMKKFRLGMNDWGEKKSDDDGDGDGDGDGDDDDDDDDEGENNRLNSVENVETNKGNTHDDFDLLLNESVMEVDLENENFDHDVNMTFSQDQLNQNHSTQNETEVMLTPEQLERIARNRKLAKERRLQRMSQQKQQPERMEMNETQIENKNSEISLEGMNLDDNN